MAAGQTPRTAGLELEPVDIVVEWARQNYIRQSAEQPPRDYLEFKESYEMEGK